MLEVVLSTGVLFNSRNDLIDCCPFGMHFFSDLPFPFLHGVLVLSFGPVLSGWVPNLVAILVGFLLGGSFPSFPGSSFLFHACNLSLNPITSDLPSSAVLGWAGGCVGLVVVSNWVRFWVGWGFCGFGCDGCTGCSRFVGGLFLVTWLGWLVAWVGVGFLDTLVCGGGLGWVVFVGWVVVFGVGIATGLLVASVVGLFTGFGGFRLWFWLLSAWVLVSFGVGLRLVWVGLRVLGLFGLGVGWWWLLGWGGSWLGWVLNLAMYCSIGLVFRSWFLDGFGSGLGLFLVAVGLGLSELGLVRFICVGLSFEVTAAISFNTWLSCKVFLSGILIILLP